MRLLDKEESGRRASDEDKKLPFGARLEIGKEEGGRKKTPYVFARPYWPLAQRTSAVILAAVTSAAVNSADLLASGAENLCCDFGRRDLCCRDFCKQGRSEGVGKS